MRILKLPLLFKFEKELTVIFKVKDSVGYFVLESNHRSKFTLKDNFHHSQVKYKLEKISKFSVF